MKRETENQYFSTIVRLEIFPHHKSMKTTQTKNKLTEIQIATQGRGFSYNSWMVKTDEKTVLGFIDKYRNTRTETHPFKVYGAKPSADGATVQYDGSVFFTVYGTKAEALALMVEKCKPVRLA